MMSRMSDTSVRSAMLWWGVSKEHSLNVKAESDLGMNLKEQLFVQMVIREQLV